MVAIGMLITSVLVTRLLIASVLITGLLIASVLIARLLITSMLIASVLITGLLIASGLITGIRLGPTILDDKAGDITCDNREIVRAINGYGNILFRAVGRQNCNRIC